MFAVKSLALLSLAVASVGGTAVDINVIDERVSFLENRVNTLSSRVLSLEYELKDLMSQQPVTSSSSRFQTTASPTETDVPEIISSEEGHGNKEVEDTGDFRPRDCSQIREELDPRQRHSTVYTIYPVSRTRPLEVYCDMHSFGGGWTVIQRRGFEGAMREDFNRTWKEYEKGFGHLGGDYWLGLENIAALTKYDDQEVLYEMLTVKDGRKSIATNNYDRFKIDGPTDLYRLHLSGFKAAEKFSTGPSFYLEQQNGLPFSTRDKDNAGTNNRSCKHNSGWWLLSTICHRQPDLNMPFDQDVLHLYKYNVIQDRHGVSIKIRARPPLKQ